MKDCGFAPWEIENGYSLSRNQRDKLHTRARWKALGFQVMDGEEPVTTVTTQSGHILPLFRFKQTEFVGKSR